MTPIIGSRQRTPGDHRLFGPVLAVLVAGALLLAVAAVQAGPTPAQQCQAGKNQTAGKYAACRENAEAKLATSGDTTKYGEAIIKCGLTFAAAWQKLEDKAVKKGTACPSMGDATGVDARVTATTDRIAASVGGGARFEDNGDGTVTDNQTGLQWEKKEYFSYAHDVFATYSWDDFIKPPTDTGFLDLLNSCNSWDATVVTGGFAGHCDWRLPTIQELQTILDMTQGHCGGGSGPCIDPIFGHTAHTTVFSCYWSSTGFGQGDAWCVDFEDGEVLGLIKSEQEFVRAVRTGS